MAVPKQPGQDAETDRKLEESVEEAFPASDPISTVRSHGARAVPPEEMLREAPMPPPAEDAPTLSWRFADAEAAKLALETLVREVPLDRRAGAIRPAADGGATLTLRTAAADTPRIAAMLGGATQA